MGPTLVQLFGDNAVFTPGAGGTLVISNSDLELQGLDTPDNPTKIAAALLKRWNEATHDKAFDPEYGLVVRNPSRQSVSRSGQNHIAYGYNASLYIPDTAPETPDPDNIVI